MTDDIQKLGTWEESRMFVSTELSRLARNGHNDRGNLAASNLSNTERVENLKQDLTVRIETTRQDLTVSLDATKLDLAVLRASLAVWNTIFGFVAGIAGALIVAWLTRK